MKQKRIYGIWNGLTIKLVKYNKANAADAKKPALLISKVQLKNNYP